MIFQHNPTQIFKKITFHPKTGLRNSVIILFAFSCLAFFCLPTSLFADTLILERAKNMALKGKQSSPPDKKKILTAIELYRSLIAQPSVDQARLGNNIGSLFLLLNQDSKALYWFLFAQKKSSPPSDNLTKNINRLRLKIQGEKFPAPFWSLDPLLLRPFLNDTQLKFILYGTFVVFWLLLIWSLYKPIKFFSSIMILMAGLFFLHLALFSARYWELDKNTRGVITQQTTQILAYPGVSSPTEAYQLKLGQELIITAETDGYVAFISRNRDQKWVAKKYLSLY